MKEIQFTKINEFSDDQLIEELMGRFDHFIISGMKVDTKGNNIVFDFKGDHGMNVNLCNELTYAIKYEEEFGEDGEEDDD